MRHSNGSPCSRLGPGLAAHKGRADLLAPRQVELNTQPCRLEAPSSSFHRFIVRKGSPTICAARPRWLLQAARRWVHPLVRPAGYVTGQQMAVARRVPFANEARILGR
jgi:hypothetical protein